MVVMFLASVVALPQSAHCDDGADPRTPERALSSLDVADGLEATLFAAEPMLLSPSNIDVDHRGRVWVCEVVNYRGRNGERPAGDRILILEDTDGDGVADKQTVYYQGRDVDSAMGICVLGNRVIVSCSPNVFVFTDDDGDDQPDKKEVLFSNTGQPQHDHSAHAFVFGPDGRLYWNFGNTGQQVCDAQGQPVVDLAGNEVIDNGKPYFGGMVFRCRPDGSDFEVLGHNFRNNYEVAVDSFGTLWQSDNDDDGNRAVRINFVMEYGNYGYRDEMTGAGWRTPRTGMHPEIPVRHWHQHDPGVVPNLLFTGAGSPTGICVYEGRLLPEKFWDQVIHCDAGPNIVRAYPVTDDGAGYQAESVDILSGSRDQWFRPSDVCVAPDGSLFVADWYDPGVGGHRMGDVDKGRIFRIAPPDTKYTVEKYNFADPNQAARALQNPNQAVQYLAWQTLSKLPRRAEPILWPLLTEENQRIRARALWLLSRIEGRGEFFAQFAVDDFEPEIRIVGLRIARELKLAPIHFVEQLVYDESPQVRRECAIALRHSDSPRAAELWAELAAQHDGKDRWYLEALGIAADGNWDACFSAWLDKVGDEWNTPAGRNIVWRSRATDTPEYLARLASDPTLDAAELSRMMRAFDFQDSETRDEALLRLALSEPAGRSADAKRRHGFVVAEAVLRLQGFDLKERPKYHRAVMRVVEDMRGSSTYVRLVDKFSIESEYPNLLSMAQLEPDDPRSVESTRTLLSKGQSALIEQGLESDEPERVAGTVRALGNSLDGRAIKLLLPVIADEGQSVEVRREAVRALSRSRPGALRLVKLAEAKRLDQSLQQAAAAALHTAIWRDVKGRAIELFPPPPARNQQPLPPLAELVQREGDSEKGRVLFNTTGTCAKCHTVNGIGKDLGPNLSEIGGKLSRQAMFESILYPSAGISHNYETHALVLEDGNVLTGIVVSQTPDELTIKDSEAVTRTVKTADIEEIVKQDVSLMPADLQKVLTAEELVDIVEYMTTLKKAVASAKN